MDRIRRTLVLIAVIATPAAAHSMFATPKALCFADGAVAYRVAPTAVSPDYRVRFTDSSAADLRIKVVDRADLADFALADDRGDTPACQSSVPVKTVKIDDAARTPDVKVSLSADEQAPDYRVYVHSLRFSQQDAAALLAVLWKAQQRRELQASVAVDR